MFVEKAKRFNDLTDPVAPFSYIEKKISSRKKLRCRISDETILKGEEVYAYRFFSLDSIGYARKKDFEASDYFINYRDCYLKNNYSIKHFKNFQGFRHPDYENILIDFSFDEAIKLITHPTTQPDSYDYLSKTPAAIKNRLISKQVYRSIFDKEIDPSKTSASSLYLNAGYLFDVPDKEIINDCSKEQRSKIDTSAVATLVSILIKCGYSEQILDRLETFPKSTLILLALLDDRRFQKKISKILKMKELPAVLDIMRKNKIYLDDFDKLKSFSNKNQSFLTHLLSSFETYQLYLVGSLDSPSSFTELQPLKYSRLVYFFIEKPEQFPLLMRYITSGEFPGQDSSSGFAYMRCYYYKAAMLHLVDKDSKSVIPWAENMGKTIGYYFSGSPKNFINYSLKMVKEKYQQNQQNQSCTPTDIDKIKIKNDKDGIVAQVGMVVTLYLEKPHEKKLRLAVGECIEEYLALAKLHLKRFGSEKMGIKNFGEDTLPSLDEQIGPLDERDSFELIVTGSEKDAEVSSYNLINTPLSYVLTN